MDPGEIGSGIDRNESTISFVRPFGYVEDRAVIHRIGDRNLYLGNRFAADPANHDKEFEYVLSATENEHPLTTHHHPLVDGPGNDWVDFAAAVDTARRLHRRDGSLLIHCTAGISRSSTLIATTLAAEAEMDLAAAFAVVRGARPSALAHPALYKLAVVYLAAQPR